MAGGVHTARPFRRPPITRVRERSAMRPSIAGLNVLLLDNYDSYSYNIFQYIAQLIGRPPLVLRNDEASDLSAFLAHQTPRVDAIVVSPGPGKPDRTEDFGLCAQAYHCGLPVLGVCLGMQGLAVAFGGLVVRAPLPMHGRLSPVEHAEEASSGSLLEGIPSPFAVVRYHSLVVHEPSLPGCLRVTARTADADRLIMAMEHQSLPLMGVQFHPESICTEHGLHLFRNFLRRVAETSTSLGPPSKAALPQPARLPPPTKLPPRAPPAALGGTRRVASRRHLLVCEPTLSRPLTAEEIFVTLFGASACSFWLDAADGSRNRFSYMGCGGGPHSFLLSQVAPTSSSDDGVRRVDLSAPRSRLQPDTEEPMAAVGAGEDGPLLGHMRAELRRWSDVTPTRCVLQPSAQPVAPAPAGRQQEARGQPCATATASSSAAAPASTPTATPVSADALPLLPDECAFRGGFVGFLGYEAWHSIGPASGASELRQRNPAVASGSHKPGGGGGGGGSGGGDPTPGAKLTLRRRHRRNAARPLPRSSTAGAGEDDVEEEGYDDAVDEEEEEPLEVEWEAVAPGDVEILARVRPLNGPAASGLLLDDGLGVVPHDWRMSKISAPANTVPSGAFVALRGGSRLGVVVLGAATSAVHLAGGVQLSVHRQMLSDDGHGLGRHVYGGGGGGRDLSDSRPGRLALKLVAGFAAASKDKKSGETQHMEEKAMTRRLREVATRSSRGAIALDLPEGCTMKTWSALAAPLPPHAHVLGVSATRPPGAPAMTTTTTTIKMSAVGGGGKGGCTLWLRLQNLSPAPVHPEEGFGDFIDAAAVEAALSPRVEKVILHPTRISGGEIGYAVWHRPCVVANA